MRFVDDDRIVFLQKTIGLGLGQQDPIGHQLDVGQLARLIIESDFVSDLLT